MRNDETSVDSVLSIVIDLHIYQVSMDSGSDSYITV
jgi:hypothetical protein